MSFFLEAEYIFLPKKGIDILEEVLPSLFKGMDEEWPAKILPDGSYITPGRIRVHFGVEEGSGIDFPVSLDFQGRKSQLCAGEILVRCLDQKIDFRFFGQIERNARYFGDEYACLGSISRFFDNGWYKGDGFPLHKEMGRMAWDSQFKEAHAELEWVYKEKSYLIGEHNSPVPRRRKRAEFV